MNCHLCEKPIEGKPIPLAKHLPGEHGPLVACSLEHVALYLDSLHAGSSDLLRALELGVALDEESRRHREEPDYFQWRLLASRAVNRGYELLNGLPGRGDAA